MGSLPLTTNSPKVVVGELVQAVHTFTLGLNRNGSDAIFLPTHRFVLAQMAENFASNTFMPALLRLC